MPIRGVSNRHGMQAFVDAPRRSPYVHLMHRALAIRSPGDSAWSARRIARAFFVASVPCIAIVLGCASPLTTIRVTDFPASGEPRRFHESFPEAYYDVDGIGNLELVLRRTTKAQDERGGSITQVIHLRAFWRPVPGKDPADESQINSVVTYAVFDGTSGTAFEGGGAVYYVAAKDEDHLTGSVDRIRLRPVRRFGSGEVLFEKAEIAGPFHARRDPHRVAQIANELERVLGPLPRYVEPATASR